MLDFFILYFTELSEKVFRPLWMMNSSDLVDDWRGHLVTTEIDSA